MRVTGALHAIRTDVVGSLLRPQAWQQARQHFDERTFSSDALQAIELACVRELVALQEAIGLDVVTDGEIGRLNFQDSFGLAVSGFDAAPRRRCMCMCDARRVARRSGAGTFPIWRRPAPRCRTGGRRSSG
jgi:methionine synthase II (cobalamin-independent)